jgi:hypothetical protein
VAPLRLGGRRGKQSTSRVWLGGTGERSTVGEQERRGSEGQGKQRGSSKAEDDGMVYWLGRMHFYFGQLNDMML